MPRRLTLPLCALPLLATGLVAAATTPASAYASTAPSAALTAKARLVRPQILTGAAAVPGSWASADDTSASVRYSGSWATSSSATDFLGTDHYASAAGATTTVTFTGTAVRVLGAMAAWHGEASMSVDGATPVVVDAYSAARADQAVLWSSPTVPSGTHTLTVTVLGRHDAASSGTVVAIDRIDVATGTPPTALPTFDDTLDDVPAATAATLTYAGPWATSTDTSRYGGSDHYASAAGASASLRFTGTGVSLTGATAPWHGRSAVSIDGGPSTVVDLYSSTRIDSVRYFTSPVLSNGSHTLTLSVLGTRSAASGGTTVTLDRLDVLGPVPATAAVVVATSSGTGPAAPPVANPGFVTRCGAKLCLDGAPYTFVGFNSYQMATLWGSNTGCGNQVSDLGAYFGSLRPNSVTRVAAEQQQAFNPATGTIDFTALDRLVTAAQQYNQKLILTLGNEWAGCDDGNRKDQAWYAGGYATVHNARGVNPLSYLDYVRRVVSRYAGSPVIAMWEPVNEPEAPTCSTGFVGDACSGVFTCPSTAAASLRSFFDAVGGQIKALDPRHLVVSGTIGDAWQCGTTAADFALVHASPGLDVATYHDYGADTTAMPGDAVNGLATRLAQAAADGKPLIVEEAGVQSSTTGSGCVPQATRVADFRAKMDALFASGGAGYLVWNWDAAPSASCDWTVAPGDPLIGLVHDYRLTNG